jgi:hypothetical protein
MGSVTVHWRDAVLNTDLAYLAGLIDGEGTIGIERREVGGHYKSPRYTMKVEIQMSDRPSIDHVARLFQRAVMVKKPSANMTKPAYRVSWQSLIALDLLESTLPYFVLKRPQAEVAIGFQRVASARRLVGTPLTERELEDRDRCYWELRRLKKAS